MDHQLAMAMAIVGIIGFLLWLFRPQAPLLVRIGVCLVAIGWLAVYCFVELSRARPEVWTGQAQMNPITMLLIAAGVYILISKPKKRNGGERSA